MNEDRLFKSLFRVYSIGVVVENKALSSDLVEVHPVEVLPFVDGELAPAVASLEASGVDFLNTAYKVKVDSTISLSAKWLPHGTNRKTPPDVRRGERVLIWQFDNTDRFYWSEMGLDDNLRKLETIIFAISATQDESDTELRDDNTYSLEVSSHHGHITLKTSQMNNEACTYTFQFNTKDGAVTLMDSIGNYFELDSLEKKLTLENASGSFVKLDKEKINAYAPDSFNLEAVNSIDLKTETFTLNAGSSISMFTKVTSIKSSASITLDTGGSVFTLTPAGTTLKTPTFAGVM